MTGSGLQLNKARAAEAVSEAGRALHLAVLAVFVETGKPPIRRELEAIAARQGADQTAVIGELQERDLLAFDATGEIRAAYPFSPTPTPIEVCWIGGPTAYAMCAIDALGVSAMLKRAVSIRATEPGSGRRIEVDVLGETAVWRPDTAVVFAGGIDDPCCPSVDRTCRHINFFADREAADRWHAAHPDVAGDILDQADALAAGVAEFGDLMTSRTIVDKPPPSEGSGEPGERPRFARVRRTGPWGTGARWAAGAALVAWGLIIPHQHPWLDLPGAGSRFWGTITGVLVIPALVTAVVALRGRSAPPLRLRGHWTACLVTAAVVALAQFFPVAVLVWIGGTLTLLAARGEDGCEVLAVPNLILRRRDYLVCLPFTPIDDWEARRRDKATAKAATTPTGAEQ